MNMRTRFVVGNLDKNLKLSCRNLPLVDIDIAASLNTYDALDCKKLVFTKILGRFRRGLKNG
jgi:ribosomal protein L4